MQLLESTVRGEPGAAQQLAPLVYDQLREIAPRVLRGFAGERARQHTLQPTALVHEAFVRLAQGTQVDWQSRTHFFAVAATTLRRVLVDHQRHRNTQKNDKGRVALSLELGMEGGREDPEFGILALDDALQTLARLSARQAKIAEQRVFGELEHREIAHVLGVSERTVRSEWAVARAWLRKELSADDSGETHPRQ